MYDVSAIQKRYFDLRLTVEDEDGQTHSVDLQVLPPTVKQMRRMVSIEKSSGDDNNMEELRDAVCGILSRNKTGYRVPVEYIDALDYDQLAGIQEAYWVWVREERQAKN